MRWIMGFASGKIQGLDDSAKRTRSNVLNQNPTQRSGRLRDVTQPA